MNSNRSLILIALLLLSQAPLLADTDALVVTNYVTPAFVNGGAGFVFSPAADMQITRVGYLDLGASNPTITIWGSTNSVITNYFLPPGTGSQQMAYMNVGLDVAAGQQYAITLEDGPLSAGNPVIIRVSTGFSVASELTNFVAATVSAGGAFTIHGRGEAYLGPNFSFRLPAVAQDIGLRAFDGGSTIKIAAEPGAPASPFRINKNGATYGILLVATNSPDASRLRIETSTGVKAWMKLP